MLLTKKQDNNNQLKGIFIHQQSRKKMSNLNFYENGKAYFPSMNEIRNFIHEVNQSEDSANHPEKSLTAAEWNGILLIDLIWQKVMLAYRKQIKQDVFNRSVEILKQTFPLADLNILFQTLNSDFCLSLNLQKDADIAIEQLILLWLLNENPAFKKYRNIFDDTDFYFDTIYLEVFDKLTHFFQDQPVFGKERLTLIKLLRKPSEESPHSILGQLEYIRIHWQEILGEDFFDLLTSIDTLKEEQKFALPGPGPSLEYDFSFMDEEPEQFSEDLDWMPKVVMVAKSTFVWLDQLSKKYGSEISRLEQIPDEELYLLHKQGFTTLWLIGIWERSKASKRIKHINGTTDAISSAYSIYEYRIADDLGGEAAFWNLKERCWRFHIRLASDMVPNHTGIDSKWVKEHPDWFLQLPYSPYPNYSFNGENLSHDDEFVVQIEDHYYNKSDAAVVFHHYDKRNGKRRYIYHGNDGTSYPWNDTAQLNYALPQVREAVIQQIIGVARKTPVIRFDAAMTLAKRHYQRLWFPEPGSGGDIPTRAEFGLSKAEFNRLFPVEFWREVVDRIAEEVPDTLLLAEAFWMMEGYFVRTLGMHRVYNSAFMNMLKDEENAKYRNSLFNIIEFNVEILKRFVNFMSNPDEETAVAQFGKHDKYFGVTVLMSTMPGLPMFAHGQIEGFTERYGMEYNRAKWNEFPDEKLVSRHEREIFPLLKRRALFSDAENFRLYDFIDEYGNLNDNVFAYSNEKYGQPSLVLYHNKFENTAGWIHNSNTVENGKWIKKTIGETLRLSNSENQYLIFQDLICRKWYVRNAKEVCEKGLYERLDAYKYKVYLDFYQVYDSEDKAYQKLADYLQGGGTEDINAALRKTYVIPILQAFHQIINRNVVTKLIKLQDVNTKEYELYLTDFLKTDVFAFYDQIARFKKFSSDITTLTEQVISAMNIWYEMQKKFKKKFPLTQKQNIELLLWLFFHKLADLQHHKRLEIPHLLHDLTLDKEVKDLFNEFSEMDSWLNLLFDYCALWQRAKFASRFSKQFMESKIISKLLKINTYNDIRWYHKESMTELITSLQRVNYLHYALADERNKYDWRRFQKWLKKLSLAHEEADCKVDDFISLL